MANISTLTVSLIAETAKFENGLKKSRKSASQFGKAIGAAFKVAALATAALAGGLGALTKKSLALVDQQRKTARTLGTSQAVFSGLSLAAGIAGQSVESFTKALKRQSKSIIDASDGLQTQKRAFDRLGLSTEALLKLPVEKQFEAITQALGNVENATLKVGIASDIYGAKNADLINILDLGANGLDTYIKKAKELGLALTDNQTKAIEESNDAVLIMTSAFTGLGNQLAATFAPAIKRTAERIANSTKNVTAAIPEWAAWAASIFNVERALDTLTLKDLTAEILQIDKDINTATGRLKSAQELFNKGLGTEADDAAFQGIVEHSAEIDRLNARYNELIRTRAELRRTGEVAIGAPGTVGTEDDLGINRGPLGAGFGISLDPAFRETADALQANVDLLKTFETEAARAFTSTRTPVEAFNLEVDRIRNNPFIDGDLQERAITEAIQRLHTGLANIEDETKKTTEAMTEFTRAAAENMEGHLSDFLFDPFADGLDGMVKGFSDTLRKMVADLLASKILNFFFGKFPSIFGNQPSLTANAIGGNVSSGRAGVVGERGPELFTPGASGAIRPLGAVTINQDVSFSGDGNLDPATLIPLLEDNNRKLKAELIDAFDRGTFQ